MYILGLDPGLNHTGWGILYSKDHTIEYVDHGVIHTNAKQTLPTRLASLHQQLHALLNKHIIDEAAVEETFVNSNATATLKLGMARGIVLAAPALAGVPVFEYGANKVKKTVTGSGHADKQKVATMLHYVLPGMPKGGASDDTDALAIALCHIQHANVRRMVG